MDARATKCVFMGYSSTQKVYKCFHRITNNMLMSRDLRFKETVLSFSKEAAHSQEGELMCDLFPLPACIDKLVHLDLEATSNHEQAEIVSEATHVPSQPRNLNDGTESTQDEHHEKVLTRRNPARARQPPARLQDYVTFASKHHITQVLSYIHVYPNHAIFLAEISHHIEPRTFQEAQLIPEWRNAMKDELHALENNQTWSIMKLPLGKKAAGSRWIYKTKFKADGSIERHKARLVARGFTQTFGVNYKETFAPVAKMNSVRVLLSVAANCGWLLYQMVVKKCILSWGFTRGSIYATSTKFFST